jgi:tRNA A-37 threonylcarbamoyl transferase component Bud32
VSVSGSKVNAVDRTEVGLVAAPTPAPAANLAPRVTVAVGGPAAQLQVEAAPVDDELKPGTRIGEYEVTGKLGEGGMGTVYSGVHPVIGKRVAIKVLNASLSQDQSIVTRFVQEARSVNRIGHRNIVDIFAFGELAGRRQYFVMEYLPGKNLQVRLDQGPMAYSEALSVLGEVCDALVAAHGEGIIHRDLKPDNIYIAEAKSGERTVKLLDFGIAKLVRNESGTPQQQTRTGVPMGTPLYMSPEQCLARTVDARTDIYALGVIMFQIFTGKLPFEGASYIETVNGHLQQPPPRPGTLADVPPSLEALILQCLEKDPARRPQSIADVRQRLRDLAGALGTAVASRNTKTPPPLSTAAPVSVAAPRGKPLLVGGVALAAVVIVGGALFGLRGQKSVGAAPASAVPAAPQLVDVQVVSDPPGGEVTIEGKKQALRTPNIFHVPRAPLLHIRVEADGHHPFETTVAFADGDTEKSAVAKLVPLVVPGGRLRITTNAKKAAWTVDGKPAGGGGPTLELDELAAGQHTVRVVAPGFEPREEALPIRSRELSSLEWTLRAPSPHHATSRPTKKSSGAAGSDDVNATSGWGQ